ncbi:hypothetical protein T492DRAFT_1035025 [Pavlovales sp. CCMP2436]|nr:hypothetical protein T492DRAFT_1035025 [Pavlovales sp. CCMP2436]
MAYNVFFTGFPVMASALDQDLPADALAAHPALYADVAHSEVLLLSSRSLCAWIGRAAFQALLLIVVPSCAFGGGFPLGGAAASDADQPMVALTAYTALILVQNLTILLEASHVTRLNALVVVGSLGAFMLMMGAVGNVSANASYGVLARLLVDPRYWLCVVLLVVGCLAPVVACKMAALHFVPPATLTLSERMALKLSSRGSGAEAGGAEPLPLFGSGRRMARRAKKDF